VDTSRNAVPEPARRQGHSAYEETARAEVPVPRDAVFSGHGAASLRF